jgi:hypothetical protein
VDFEAALVKSLKLALLVILAAPMGAAVRPHPRLEVDAALIKQLRSLRERNDPAWARMTRWLADKPAGRDTNRVLASMLAFLVTGEGQQFDRGWEVVRRRIYRNGSDRGGGIMPLLDLYKGNKHEAAFQGGVLLGVIAHFYDWGHARLSTEQKEDIVEWLNAAAAFEHFDCPEGRLYLRNDGASVLQGLAAAAYATQGENSKGELLMGWFREHWVETVKGLDIIGKGGASGEGNAYGTSPTAQGIITAAHIAYTAAGEDLFSTHPFFRQRLLYDAFAAYPDTIGGPADPVRYLELPLVEQASIGGDGRRAASWHNRDTRRNGLLLSRRFAGSEEAAVWNWVFRQPAVDQSYDEGESVYDLLYYSPRPRLVKPTRLSFFDPSMGYVYIRSDWDSPDATWIAFWAGPHIDTHQHLDQGAFAVFKRRDLAPKTGHYDTDVFFPHQLAWYTRTVSSNGILVGDPKEIFRGFIAGMGCDENGKVLREMTASKWPACIPNDGGQRTFAPRGMAVTDAETFYKNRDIFDVARVVSFRDDGRAVSVVADITNAYNNPRHTTPGNSPKVNRVYRRLVYLRGLDMLLLADTVESTDAKFEKKWLIHALERVDVVGTVEKIDAGESVHRGVDEAKIVVDDSQPSDKDQTTYDLRRGYAALLIKTLSPAPFRYRKIGGREPADSVHGDLYNPNRTARHYHRHLKDFWVKDFSEGVIPNHKSYNWAPEYPHEVGGAPAYVPVYGPGYGRWRLEIEPETPARTDYMLNVLKPALDASDKLPPIRKIDGEGMFGAEIVKDGKKYTVLFPKDSLAAPQLSIR